MQCDVRSRSLQEARRDAFPLLLSLLPSGQDATSNFLLRQRLTQSVGGVTAFFVNSVHSNGKPNSKARAAFPAWWTKIGHCCAGSPAFHGSGILTFISSSPIWLATMASAISFSWLTQMDICKVPAVSSTATAGEVLHGAGEPTSPPSTIVKSSFVVLTFITGTTGPDIVGIADEEVFRWRYDS